MLAQLGVRRPHQRRRACWAPEPHAAPGRVPPPASTAPVQRLHGLSRTGALPARARSEESSADHPAVRATSAHRPARLGITPLGCHVQERDDDEVPARPTGVRNVRGPLVGPRSLPHEKHVHVQGARRSRRRAARAPPRARARRASASASRGVSVARAPHDGVEIVAAGRRRPPGACGRRPSTRTSARPLAEPSPALAQRARGVPRFAPSAKRTVCPPAVGITAGAALRHAPVPVLNRTTSSRCGVDASSTSASVTATMRWTVPGVIRNGLPGAQAHVLRDSSAEVADLEVDLARQQVQCLVLDPCIWTESASPAFTWRIFPTYRSVSAQISSCAPWFVHPSWRRLHIAASPSPGTGREPRGRRRQTLTERRDPVRWAVASEY